MATSLSGMPEPPLDIEQEEDVIQWRRGCALRSLIASTEWEILCDTLTSYADKAEYELFRLPPGDPSVPTAHAAWSAIKQMSNQFKLDVEKCVQDSYHTPESIKRLAMLGANE